MVYVVLKIMQIFQLKLKILLHLINLNEKFEKSLGGDYGNVYSDNVQNLIQRKHLIMEEEGILPFSRKLNDINKLLLGGYEDGEGGKIDIRREMEKLGAEPLQVYDEIIEVVKDEQEFLEQELLPTLSQIADRHDFNEGWEKVLKEFPDFLELLSEDLKILGKLIKGLENYWRESFRFRKNQRRIIKDHFLRALKTNDTEMARYWIRKVQNSGWFTSVELRFLMNLADAVGEENDAQLSVLVKRNLFKEIFNEEEAKDFRRILEYLKSGKKIEIPAEIAKALAQEGEKLKQAEAKTEIIPAAKITTQQKAARTKLIKDIDKLLVELKNLYDNIGRKVSKYYGPDANFMEKLESSQEYVQHTIKDLETDKQRLLSSGEREAIVAEVLEKIKEIKIRTQSIRDYLKKFKKTSRLESIKKIFRKRRSQEEEKMIEFLKSYFDQGVLSHKNPADLSKFAEKNLEGFGIVFDINSTNIFSALHKLAQKFAQKSWSHERKRDKFVSEGIKIIKQSLKSQKPKQVARGQQEIQEAVTKKLDEQQALEMKIRDFLARYFLSGTKGEKSEDQLKEFAQSELFSKFGIKDSRSRFIVDKLFIGLERYPNDIRGFIEKFIPMVKELIPKKEILHLFISSNVIGAVIIVNNKTKFQIPKEGFIRILAQKYSAQNEPSSSEYTLFAQPTATNDKKSVYLFSHWENSKGEKLNNPTTVRVTETIHYRAVYVKR